MKNTRLVSLFVVVFILCGAGYLPFAQSGGIVSATIVDQNTYRAYHSRYNQGELSSVFGVSQKDSGFVNLTQKGIQPTSDSVQNFQSSSKGPLDSPWPMMSHDVYRNGRSPYNTTQPPEGVEIWRFDASDSFEGGVVIDKDGILYSGCMDGHVYAVYPNGTMKWKTNLYQCIIATPSIDENGILYIGTIWATGTHNFLAALYTNNGTLKWSYPTGSFGDIDSSPAIGADGTIYFGSEDHWFYALNPDGSTKWKYQTGDVITGSPAIRPDGTVYIGSQNSILYAFNPDNGSVKWMFDTGGCIRVSPCVGDDGTVYCVSFDNYLYAVYPNNGTMKWKTFVNAGTNPTIGPDGTIYAGWNILYAINPVDGSEKWNYTVNGYIEGGTPCTSQEGVIYLGTSYGSEFIAINPDGTMRWRCHIGVCQSPPAIGSDGTIYIGSESPGAAIHAYGHGPLRTEAYGPYQGLVNTSIQFTGDGFGGALPYTFLWDFGDNQTSNEQNPKHMYTGPGTFNITLTIQDGYGNSTTDNATATITYPGPTVRITKPNPTKSGLYFFDRRILPFPLFSIVICGPITIEATATQTPLGISHVDFYADDTFIGTDTEPPYSCVCRGALKPRLQEHALVVRAFDNGGRSEWTRVYVYKLF